MTVRDENLTDYIKMVINKIKSIFSKIEKNQSFIRQNKYIVLAYKLTV